MIHKKKILSKFFKDVVNGTKTFEIRKEDDCYYEVGDTIELTEIDDHCLNDTGNILNVEITYRLDSNDFPSGLEDGYVISGIRRLDDETICTICQASLSKWLLNGDRVEYCGYCGNEIDWSDEE